MAEARKRPQAGGGFVSRHWKEVLAVLVAAVPVLAYFLLRRQGGNALPGSVYLPTGGGSSSSAGAPSPASSPASTPWSSGSLSIPPGLSGGVGAPPYALPPGSPDTDPFNGRRPVFTGI